MKPTKKMITVALAAMIATLSPSGANAGLFGKAAVGTGVLVGGRFALVVAEVMPSAMVALRAYGTPAARIAIEELSSILMKHRVFGPRVLQDIIARQVADRVDLHEAAVWVTQSLGIDSQKLFRLEEKKLSEALAESASLGPNDEDPCDRHGNDGPYRAREISDTLNNRYGAGNVESSTIPPKKMPNVRASMNGLLVEVVEATATSPAKSVFFDARGWPSFDPFTKLEVNFLSANAAFMKATRPDQLAMSTQQLRSMIEQGTISASKFTERELVAIRAGVASIPGWTWHHHQDLGRMQLVEREVHENAKHVGGWWAWRWYR